MFLKWLLILTYEKVDVANKNISYSMHGTHLSLSLVVLHLASILHLSNTNPLSFHFTLKVNV